MAQFVHAIAVIRKAPVGHHEEDPVNTYISESNILSVSQIDGRVVCEVKSFDDVCAVIVDSRHTFSTEEVLARYIKEPEYKPNTDF
jgi:hypothetical protein